MGQLQDGQWTVGASEGLPLAAFLREQLAGESWSAIKALIATGKVSVDGEAERDPARRLLAGETVSLRMASPRERPRGAVRILFEDAHLVIIDKPAGVMSVPFQQGDRGTAMDLIREAWRRQGRSLAPLFVVHRLDKDTSGVMAFAKTRRAERDLGQAFRRRELSRSYACVAHGEVVAQTIESALVADRGDGLRGTGRTGGKVAVTHVRPVRPLAGATLCEVRLGTGRTHQIRIHLAEAGHPLLGERVYIRDFLRQGRTPLPADRLMLHARELGFLHPITGAETAFDAPLPADFARILEDLKPGDSV